MTDCIFCKISAGEVSVHKVYEDDNAIAFLDHNPLTLGHTVVLPKSHHEYMTDTPDELVAKVSVLAKNLANNYKPILKAEGFYYLVAGVDVAHFHFHVIPRYDDADLELNPTNKPKDLDLAEVAAKLRND